MRHVIASLIILVSLAHAQAFSLRGPVEPWMTTNLDYGRVGDFGGPMALGNEYRWNLPTLTYGFDQSFLDFFGERGVQAVEEAVAILNALPPASEMNVDTFPNDTLFSDPYAGLLELTDLKSVALALLVQQLGLAEPEKYVWTLRARQVSGAYTNYVVIQRNYDPNTLLPTSFINGTEYWFHIFELWAEGGWTFATTATCPDIMAFPGSTVAQYGINGPTVFPCTNYHSPNLPGMFYAGLTRDDAGGLRYLYHPTNINVEPLLPGITPVEMNSTALVNVAPRPGVNKINFTRMQWDTNRSSFRVMTNVFTDTYLSNSLPRQQTLQRVLDRPDITFRACDLGVKVNYYQPMDLYSISTPEYRVSGVSSWINNAALNERPTGAGGPGTIPSGRTIEFSALAHGHLGQLGSLALDYVFGSFDGSTNDPVTFDNKYATSLTLESSVTNGSFIWKLLGTYGTYRIDSSTNLIDWSEVTSVTNTRSYFSVTNAVSSSREFYRAVRTALE
jgi:hypothetical protein